MLHFCFVPEEIVNRFFISFNRNACFSCVQVLRDVCVRNKTESGGDEEYLGAVGDPEDKV